jgi:hypothetical protein
VERGLGKALSDQALYMTKPVISSQGGELRRIFVAESATFGRAMRASVTITLVAAGLFLFPQVGASASEGAREARSGWERCSTIHPSITQKARRVNCSRAARVAKKAQRKFCRRPGRCSYYDPPEVERGVVRLNGWKCRVLRRPTYGHTICRKGKMRSYRSQAAF